MTRQTLYQTSLNYLNNEQLSFSDLKRHRRILLNKSISTATAKIYDRYLKKFEQFACTVSRRPRFNNSTIELWLVSLKKEGLAYGTIRSHLSALHHHCHKKGIPISDSPRLCMLLKGIKNDSSRPSTKNTVTISHMKRLCAAAEKFGDQELKLKTMITLAFFGFLRPSEFCVTNAHHHLLRKSIKIHRKKKSCNLRFNSYKHGTKPTTIRIDRYSKMQWCPVRLLDNYLKSEQKNRNDPLFDMTPEQFRDILTELCTHANIRTKLTPHSFRHGGATWAASMQWSDARIRSHGRWKSDAFKKYIHSC